MPWRFITVIIIFAILLVFITFNLENKCDISFGFIKIEQVPVFLTVFVSFALGLLFMSPFVFRAAKARKNPSLKKAKHGDDFPPVEKPAEFPVDEKIRQDAARAKERFFSKRRGGKNA